MYSSRSLIQSIITFVLAPFILLGNFAVCAIVFKEQRMRTFTNYLLANLALADLLYGLTEVAEILVFYISTHFKPGYVCRITGYLTFTTLTVSLATLTVIARERYAAVAKPLLSRRSHRKHSLVLIAATWLAGVLFTCPIIFLSRESSGIGRTTCEVSPVNVRFGIYHVCLGVLGILIPSAIIMRCYFKIICTLWRPRRIIRASGKSLTESRRKLTKLLIFISLVFVSCWVTLCIEQVIFMVDIYSDEFEVFCYLMLHLSACSNPIAYSLHSPKFRQRIKGLLCRCRVKRRVAEPVGMVQLKHYRPRFILSPPRVNPAL